MAGRADDTHGVREQLAQQQEIDAEMRRSRIDQDRLAEERERRADERDHRADEREARLARREAEADRREREDHDEQERRDQQRAIDAEMRDSQVLQSRRTDQEPAARADEHDHRADDDGR